MDRQEIDNTKIQDEPQFEDVENTIDDDDDFDLDNDDDLNFNEEMGSSLENELFEDSDLMAEIGVELIDLLIVLMVAKQLQKIGVMKINTLLVIEKKAKLKKPLAQLLRKKGTKIEPEIYFWSYGIGYVRTKSY